MCFDIVGWASTRVCRNWLMRCWHGYLSGLRCWRFAYATPSFVASLPSRIVLSVWCRLTHVVLIKRPLSRCLFLWTMNVFVCVRLSLCLCVCVCQAASMSGRRRPCLMISYVQNSSLSAISLPAGCQFPLSTTTQPAPLMSSYVHCICCCACLLT